MRRPPSSQHRLAVEMLRFIPKREELNKGERRECISVLYALTSVFDHEEVLQICQEAQWVSPHWDPAKELSGLGEPENSIGTLIVKARARGWQWHEGQVLPPMKALCKAGPGPTLGDLFPDELTAALKIVCKYLPYDDDLIAGTFLVAVAGLQRMGASLMCNRLSNFSVPLNLFMATVGDSGTKKSPLERTLIEHPYQEVRTQLATMHESILKEWKAGKPKKTEKQPQLPRLTVKDVTGEALEKQLCVQEKHLLGLLLKRDELAGFFAGMNQHKGGKGNDEQALLEYFDGSGVETIRATSPNRICRRSLLSIYGAIQPAVLQQMQKGVDHNGKWARFLFVYLPAKPTPLPESISADEQKAFESAQRYLQRLALAIRKQPGIQYELNEEAIRRFAGYEYQQQLKAVEARLPSQAAIMNKSAGKVGRIAGLLHVIHQAANQEMGTLPEVEVGMVEAAIRLVDHCDRWAMQFQRLSNSSSEEKLMLRLHQLAEKSKSSQSTSQLLQGLSSAERDRNGANADVVVDLLRKLAEAGYGEISEGQRGGLRYKALVPSGMLEQGWTDGSPT
jgi:hypothetical protein